MPVVEVVDDRLCVLTTIVLCPLIPGTNLPWP